MTNKSETTIAMSRVNLENSRNQALVKNEIKFPC